MGECLHNHLLIHVFVEKQVPHLTEDGAIEEWGEDDASVIRLDMGAVCQGCQEFDVHFDDWRTAPAALRATFSRVRKNAEQHGYPDPYATE